MSVNTGRANRSGEELPARVAAALAAAEIPPSKLGPAAPASPSRSKAGHRSKDPRHRRKARAPARTLISR
jgi:hypothetical protein